MMGDSNWKQWQLGEKIPFSSVDQNDENHRLNYHTFLLKADLNAVATTWGANEAPRWSWVIEERKWYSWNGSVNQQMPVTGGTGAPITCSYVTLGAESELSNETVHSTITDQAFLHIPKYHHLTHENGEADEISVTGLSGLLANNQSAGYINSVPIDNSTTANNRFLKVTYAWGVPFKIEWVDLPGGGDMTSAVYAATGPPGIVDEAWDAMKLQGHAYTYFSHNPHAIHHATGDTDPFAVTDLLDAVARVGIRKNSAGTVYLHRGINLIEGSGITLSVSPDDGDEETDVTITAGGSGLAGTWTKGVASIAGGKNGGTFPHGLGETPVGVLLTPNAVQPVAFAYTTDATNVTVHHNFSAPVTFSYLVWK